MRKRLRLEQERIGFRWMNSALDRLVQANDAVRLLHPPFGR
jgi:hypothetical protein